MVKIPPTYDRYSGSRCKRCFIHHRVCVKEPGETKCTECIKSGKECINITKKAARQDSLQNVTSPNTSNSLLATPNTSLAAPSSSVPESLSKKKRGRPRKASLRAAGYENKEGGFEPGLVKTQTKLEDDVADNGKEPYRPLLPRADIRPVPAQPIPFLSEEPVMCCKFIKATYVYPDTVDRKEVLKTGKVTSAMTPTRLIDANGFQIPWDTYNEIFGILCTAKVNENDRSSRWFAIVRQTEEYAAELVELVGNLLPVKQLDEVDKGLGECLIQHGGGIRFECEDHDDYTWDLVKGEYKLRHL